jgi:RNA polymerase sigma-70 factor (ECF subfamily)
VFRRAWGQQAERVVAYDADRSAVDAARREPRQFEALYRKYVGQVYSFALYELRDHHAAEDVTEHVFLRALAGLSRFEERGDGERSTFRVWLFQIARRAISNERRRARRRLEAPLEVAEAVAAGDDPATVAARREMALRAWDAVQRLPAERRRAVVLRFVEEMTTREIAGVLGRSEGAVRVLMHRALRSVAEELRGDERRNRS